MPGPTKDGSTPSSSPDTLLQKLDQLDARLKQLEEKQRLPQSYFSADLYQSSHQLVNPATLNFDPQCQSLAPALKEVHFKSTLMDRLRILEARILQLSTELEKGSTASSSSKDSDENRSKQSTFPSDGFDSGAEKPTGKLDRGSNQLQGKKFKKLQKVKESKESIGKGEKTSACQNVKKKNHDRRVYKRWFAIGC